MSGLPPKPVEELTPTQLVVLWKKSGEFDKLRKRLLSDFLSSPDKDQLVTQLDSILPSLLSSAVPPISRIPRKDRPSHILDSLDRKRKETPPSELSSLDESVEKVRKRLTKKGDKGSRGLGRTIERELRGCKRKYWNVEGGDEGRDSQEEEGDEDVKEETKEVAKEATLEGLETEPTAAPTTTREPSNGPALNGNNNSPAAPTVSAGATAASEPTSLNAIANDSIVGGREDDEMRPVVDEESTNPSTTVEPASSIPEPSSTT